MERTKNAIRNIVFGTGQKVVGLIIPFILRTIIINTIGIQYVGLGGLFASILQVLSLADLGINSAIVFSMYGAIVSNNKQEICALMNYYKKFYRVVGITVMCLGLMCLPFLRNLISGETPDGINIYILYCITLANTCLTYFLFAYKSCLFTAHQRSDVISKVGTGTSLATYIIQGILLLLFKNYYLFVIINPIATVVNNIIISNLAEKTYPEYFAEGVLSDNVKKDISRKISSLFLYKVGGVVLSSVDTIVISSFLGLTILGKYNNYYYIITTLFGFLEVFYSSMTAGIGNSIKIDTKEKNKHDFDRLVIVNGWIIGWSTVCLVCLYQPFMYLWVGTEMMFSNQLVILLAVLFFSWKMMDIVNLYKTAAGLWEYDKWRQVVGSGINLLLNLVLVHYIGIYGIVLSTVVAIIAIIFPWSTYVLFKFYFNFDNYKLLFFKYVIRIATFWAITILTGGLTLAVCNYIGGNTVFSFLIKAIICVIIPNVLFFFMFSMLKEFSDTKSWILYKIKNMMK